MFESNQSYRDVIFDRALAKAEFKWLRNLVLAAIGTVVLSQLRTGRPMPGLIDFLVPALLFAGWEGALFVRRRFWTVPEEVFTEQQERINELERELYETTATLNTKRKNKALADVLRALDTRAVNELWAVPQPLNEFESPKWLAKLDAWEEEVLAVIKRDGDADDLRHVQTLGNIYDPSRPRIHHDSRMNQRIAMLDERRKRIQNVSKKYDPEAL